MKYSYASVDILWLNTLVTLFDQGVPHNSRNGESLELCGYTARLESIGCNWLMNPVRKASPIYAAGEMLWYLSMGQDGEMICHYAPSYKHFLNEGKAYGAYGKRWFDYNQMSNVVDLLKTKPNTRQAILEVWDRVDVMSALEGKMKDIPCTLNLQFLIRDKKLHCITTMRSNDVWLGMPYDIFCFTMLQSMIADHLGIESGWYQHNVGSLHLYDTNKKKAEKAIHENDFGSWFSLEFPSDRNKGFFIHTDIVRQVENEIRVKYINLDYHLSITGKKSKWSLLLALAAMQSIPVPDEVTFEILKQYIPEPMIHQAIHHQRRRDEQRSSKS